MIKKSLILKSGLAVGLSIGLSLGFISPNDYAYAIEGEKTESVANSSGKIVQLNENLARIDLEDNVTYDIDENGIATLKDTKTNEIEQLPVTAKDKNGEEVVLIYFEEDGELGFYVQEKRYERGAVSCTVGIAGGALAGATTGGLTGAGVGTVTLPIVGTVSGATVGVVGGGIGGGMTGGAASC